MPFDMRHEKAQRTGIAMSVQLPGIPGDDVPFRTKLYTEVRRRQGRATAGLLRDIEMDLRIVFPGGKKVGTDEI